MTSDKIHKNDFIELKYTGYANGSIFDSNIEEDLKKISPEEKPQKTIIAVGHEMVVKGLDKCLEEKEIGKEYEITLSPKDSFGERKRELVKTIPLKAFTDQKVNPYPGLVLTLDNLMVKIITVSGARVVTDFNNPLSGKEIKYKFTAVRKVNDEKEKVDSLFGTMLKFIPEYEIKDNIVMKGPKALEVVIKAFSDKFKELVGKPLILEEVKITKKDKKEDPSEHDHSHDHHNHSHDHTHEHHDHEHTHDHTHSHDHKH